MSLKPFQSDQSFLLITLDSCRWDSFERARTPKLSSLGEFRRAYSHGTYTLPAHMSMYNGILPHVQERVPYYNRFCRDLLRIESRPTLVEPHISFPSGTPDIFSGFAGRGYRTIGLGSVEWFRSEVLRMPFAEFLQTGIHLEHQLEWLVQRLRTDGRPAAMMLNVGETHEPYECGGLVSSASGARNVMRSFVTDGYHFEEHERQVRCCEYIDSRLGPFLSEVRRSVGPALVVVCGDHGECFGEDGLYGHGFFHPKVLEVPLAIFDL